MESMNLFGTKLERKRWYQIFISIPFCKFDIFPSTKNQMEQCEKVIIYVQNFNA